MNKPTNISKANTQIIILMATYNGGKYLASQIESIINQTYKNWILLIRDDDSNDNTGLVISQYTSKFENIQQINYPGKKKGALSNFTALYNWMKKNMNPEYVMFCDQDDIWMPEKIERSVNYMHDLENSHGYSPLLIYSDLEFINEKGEDLNTRINVLPKITFNQIIAQNYCFGCTMLLNKKLVDEIDEISEYADNHDHWIALVATSLGRACYLDGKVILYRQHSLNVTSQGNSLRLRIERYTKGLKTRVNNLSATLVMLNHFYQVYYVKLDLNKREILGAYLAAYGSGFINVVKTIIKYKILRKNYLQNIGFLILIINFLRRKPTI